MTDFSEREVAIFSGARRLPAGERAAYLDDFCAGDTTLRRRVEELLEANDEAGNFLENPAPVLPARVAPVPGVPAEKPGDNIGRYKLLQQIGEGGCGIVYMAEQQEPVRRQVALKIIKLGMDTRQVIARFEAERQALALMDHPSIAKVLDAGATETGRPYFVMELVRGVKITEFCDKNHLSTAQRLKLFIQVCHAVQHAHQKGIIHRDLKPSNILVTLNDGVPLPKVIDFGIAKATQQRLTDKTLFTAFEQFIGTPAYMSPEQAEMNAQGVDTRSDIYSLGVLLYELLTGRTPFETQKLLRAGVDEIRRIIREEEPMRPSTKLSTMLDGELTVVANHRQTAAPKLINTVRGDLDWIVIKALEKDRQRRFESASHLAADIQRHLNHETVLARPPSATYRLQKTIRRNRLASMALLAILLSLITGLVASNYFRLQERQALREAWLSEARGHLISGRAGQRFDSLSAITKAAAIKRDAAARDEAIAAMALSDARVTGLVDLKPVFAMGRLCADVQARKYAVLENGHVAVRLLPDARLFAELAPPGFTAVDVANFSPDSRYLRVICLDSNQAETDWVWDLTTSAPVISALPAAGIESAAKCFSPDSRFLGRCASDGTCDIYELATGKVLKKFRFERGFSVVKMSPDNTRLAVGSADVSAVEIRELVHGSNILSLSCPMPAVALNWSFDGRLLAVACQDQNIYVRDAITGGSLAKMEGSLNYVTDLAFDHAGDLLASFSWDGVVRLWDPASGRQMVQFGINICGPFEFSPDDRFLGPALSSANQVGLLEVSHGERRLLRNPYSHSDFFTPGVNFSPDGRVVVAGTENHICFWDARTGAEIGALPVTGKPWSKIFHPDGHELVVADRDKGISVFPWEKLGGFDSVTCRLGPPRLLFKGEGFREADLSRDGRWLAVANFDEAEGFVFDLQNPGHPVVLNGHPRMDYMALSPDGMWAATGSWHNSLVKIWNARTGSCLKTLELSSRARAVFTPDGQWLATAAREYQLWKTGTWAPKGAAIPGQRVGEWNAVAFSSDGRIMATTHDRDRITLRETASGRVLANLESSDSIVRMDLQFSPDDTQLAARRMDGQVDLWNLRHIRHELSALRLDWEQPPYPPAEPETIQKSVTLEIERE